MSEWIEHNGKGAPDLPPGVLVRTRRFGGSEDSPDNSSTWEWWHGNGETSDESNWIWPEKGSKDPYISHYIVVDQ